MKHIKFKIIRSFIALLIAGTTITFGAAAQTNGSTEKISSEVKVKEAGASLAVLDLSVSNSIAAPFLVVIRDEEGAMVFREWVNAAVYQKRFQMSLEKSDSYRFEILQNKKLVDTKTFVATRRMEEFIEVVAIK